MSSAKNRKILKSAFIFIFVFSIIIIIAFPLFIKSAINSEYIKKEISLFISKKTGNKINQGKITIKFLPRPYIKIDGIKTKLKLADFTNDDNNKEPKQNINKKSSKHCKLECKKNQNHLSSDTGNSGNNINITIGTILFYPNLRTILQAGGKNISGSLILKKLSISSNPQCTLPVIKNIKSFSFEYIKAPLSFQIDKILKASITAINPELILKNKKNSKISGKRLTAYINLTHHKIQISINKFVLDYPSMIISINFLHDKKNKKASLKFSGQKVCIDEIKQVSYSLLKNNTISNEIFKIVRSGQANNLMVSFHGNNLKTLFHEKNMIIKGTIKDGAIGIPETNLVTSKTQGRAVVKNGILYTDVPQGYIKNSIFKQAKLKVDLFNHNHPFQGTFPIGADLNELSNILKQLLQGTSIEHELNLCKNIKGRANGILILGKQKNENRVHILVKVHNIHLSAEYKRIPEIIKINGGNFIYNDDTSIDIDNIDGSIGKTILSNIKASIELRNKNTIRIKSGKIAISTQELFPWFISFNDIKKYILPIKFMSGTINIDSININGPMLKPYKWKYNINGNCKGIAIGTKTPINEIKNINLSFKLSNKMKSFSNINARLYRTKLLSAFMKTKLIKNIAMPVSLYNGEFHAKKNETEFKGKFLFKTGPEILLAISDSTGGGRASANSKANTHTIKKIMKYYIQLSIKDGKISNASLVYNGKSCRKCRHFNIKGILSTRTILKLLVPGTKIAKEFLKLTGNRDIKIISNNNSGLTISTDILDIDTLTKVIQSESPQKTNDLYSYIHFPLTFNIKSDKCIYKTMIFTPFQASVAMYKDSWTIFIENTKLCNMNIEGIIDKKHKLDISFELYAEKDNLAQFISCLFDKKQLIKGKYSIRADFNSIGNMYQLMDNLNGKIEFSSQDGRIYKLTLLSRILSVINISKFIHGKIPDIIQNGFAYNSLYIKAYIKKSRIILKSAVIKGVDMTFVFKGWIDMMKRTMKLTCIVSPFKTADMIIKHLPILDHILNNRLISFPVEIKGNINNPDIVLLPPSEIGKGLLDMMQRIMTTPFRIIKDIPQ